MEFNELAKEMAMSTRRFDEFESEVIEFVFLISSGSLCLPEDLLLQLIGQANHPNL